MTNVVAARCPQHSLRDLRATSLFDELDELSNLLQTDDGQRDKKQYHAKQR